MPLAALISIPVIPTLMKPFLSSVLALGLALSFSSCATRFNHDWKKAAAAAESTAPQSVTGAWQGTWKSEATGHQGTLKAVVTKVNPKDNLYAFEYRATWGNIFSATFPSEHTVNLQGKNYVLTGHHNLGGLFGGVYHYDGTATPTLLQCRYRSKLDHGLFEMQRP